MIAWAWLTWCGAAVATLAARMRVPTTEPVVECTRCRGRGFVLAAFGQVDCWACRGTGYRAL